MVGKKGREVCCCQQLVEYIYGDVPVRRLLDHPPPWPALVLPHLPQRPQLLDLGIEVRYGERAGGHCGLQGVGWGGVHQRGGLGEMGRRAPRRSASTSHASQQLAGCLLTPPPAGAHLCPHPTTPQAQAPTHPPAWCCPRSSGSMSVRSGRMSMSSSLTVRSTM